MTTDEMIMDLVAKHGFKLPADVCRHYDPVNKEDCFALRMRGVGTGVQHRVLISDQQAHDLCAMHFAREIQSRRRELLDSVPDQLEFLSDFALWMGDGDSPAAIRALWEALQ